MLVWLLIVVGSFAMGDVVDHLLGHLYILCIEDRIVSSGFWSARTPFDLYDDISTRR